MIRMSPRGAGCGAGNRTTSPLRAVLRPEHGAAAGRCTARIGGRLRRWLAFRARARSTRAVTGDWLIEPEIFSPSVGARAAGAFCRHLGPARGVVSTTPPPCACRSCRRRRPWRVIPAYLQELLRFDGIAAISEESRAVLVDYWRWLGAAHPPPVIGLPLGVDPPVPAAFGHTTADRRRARCPVRRLDRGAQEPSWLFLRPAKCCGGAVFVLNSS